MGSKVLFYQFRNINFRLRIDFFNEGQLIRLLSEQNDEMHS